MKMALHVAVEPHRFLQLSFTEAILILSKWACVTITRETNYAIDEVKKLVHHSYDVDDLSAPLSSGSFLFQGMVIIPCSMKTLASIACGYVDY